MAIITVDALLTGIRRDDLFDWLGDPANHDLLVKNAFDAVAGSTGRYEFRLTTPGRTRTMGYEFESKDDTHGGRRIIVKTTGKRTKGHINYSLRTMKPSTNTMVTIRMDYTPGGTLGELINSSGLAKALEQGLRRILDNLETSIPRNG